MGKRIRTTIFIDEDLVKLSKVKALDDNGSGGSLSDVVENALKSYLPPAIGIQFTSKGTTFHSGPTISELKPHDISHGLQGDDMLKPDNSEDEAKQI